MIVAIELARGPLENNGELLVVCWLSSARLWAWAKPEHGQTYFANASFYYVGFVRVIGFTKRCLMLLLQGWAVSHRQRCMIVSTPPAGGG